MRISADPNDSGYTVECMREYEVYLGGVLQSNVVTADDEEGVVIPVPEDEGGRIVIEDHFAEQKLRGSVRLKRRLY